MLLPSMVQPAYCTDITISCIKYFLKSIKKVYKINTLKILKKTLKRLHMYKFSKNISLPNLIPIFAFCYTDPISCIFSPLLVDCIILIPHTLSIYYIYNTSEFM